VCGATNPSPEQALAWRQVLVGGGQLGHRVRV
jgi:hypothetical protein